MKVTIIPWDHQCADGCCYDWGNEVWLDDYCLGKHYSDAPFQLIEDLVEYFMGVRPETEIEEEKPLA